MLTKSTFSFSISLTRPTSDKGNSISVGGKGFSYTR